MSKRILCIGDIHGGFKALVQVIERAQVTSNDTIIFLGDYVDGWGESFELIEYLIALSETHRCIFIQGNHDVWMNQWLTDGVVPVIGPYVTWRDRGGNSTLKSYMERPPSDIEPHRIFFRRLHHFYEDHANRVYLHAGYTQGGGVRFENPMRNLWWDRGMFEMAYLHQKRHGDNPQLYKEMYPTILKTYYEIYVGHTSTQHWDTLQPIQACNVINLDTGGGHLNGRLTIMDVDSKEYWQSDKLKDLYPDDPHCEFMKNEGSHLN